MAIEDLNSKDELWRWIVEQAESEGLPMSAIQGLQQAVTPGKWVPLVLEEGWANYGGGFSPAAYRTTPGNGVQLRGMITKAAEPFSGQFSTIPAGLAPKEALQFTTSVGVSQLAVVEIDNITGALLMAANSATAISLSGIVFWPGS